MKEFKKSLFQKFTFHTLTAVAVDLINAWSSIQALGTLAFVDIYFTYPAFKTLVMKNSIRNLFKNKHIWYTILTLTHWILHLKTKQYRTTKYQARENKQINKQTNYSFKKVTNWARSPVLHSAIPTMHLLYSNNIFFYFVCQINVAVNIILLLINLPAKLRNAHTFLDSRAPFLFPAHENALYDKCA